MGGWGRTAGDTLRRARAISTAVRPRQVAASLGAICRVNVIAARRRRQIDPSHPNDFP
jgi:hypothetical protein